MNEQALDAAEWPIVRRLVPLSMAAFAVLACAPAPRVGITVRPELRRGVAIWAPVWDTGAPPSARRGALDLLRTAGFVVDTAAQHAPAEVLRLLLYAECSRDSFRRQRCGRFTLRVVDATTSEVLAATALDPSMAKRPRLSAILDTVRGEFTRRLAR